MTPQELLAALNTAFENEYNDVMLYLREAELFRTKIVDGEKIGDLFDFYSGMELRHADRLAMKLIELGAEPRWVFKPLETERSLHAVLKKHIANEAQMYQFYGTMIEAVTDKDFRLILRGIRDEEKEHLDKAVYLLKRIG